MPAWAWALAALGGVLVVAGSAYWMGRSAAEAPREAADSRSGPTPEGAGDAEAVPRSSRRGELVAADESAAIGDVRTVISAQAAYQSANGGWYEGQLSCLSSPTSCIPGYPANGPIFLDPQLASLAPRAGFAREFHPGPAPDAVNPAFSSASSVSSFAYTAVPVARDQTGARSFCGDSSGALIVCPDGSPPVVNQGLCALDAEGCRVLP
jgi:hypothetical protein